MSTAAPVKTPPAPPPPKGNGLATTPRQSRTFNVSNGAIESPLKVVIFGSGGTGKTELAAHLKQQSLRMLFLDLEQGSRNQNVARIDDIQSFDELRSILRDDSILGSFDGVVIDSLTRGEELATEWVIKNIPHEKKDKTIKGIEDYGFGKGYTHVYEALLLLLADLDALNRRGKHVVCIAHECIAVPENPDGDNFAEAQPRLQTTKSGAHSFRYRVREWADHLLCIKFDVAVVDGKGTGTDTRTIYTQKRPSLWAKSRTLDRDIPYAKGSDELWRQLLNK